MKPRDPSLHVNDNAEPLFSADLRAELRRELGPSAANRARVRDALWSSVATGTLSPTAQRVDTLLHGQSTSAAGTAGAAGAKAATATAVHSLTAKLVIASVLVGGGATAVMLRERPAVVAPATAKPVVSAAQNEPALHRELPAAHEAEAAPAAEALKPNTPDSASNAAEVDSTAVPLQPTASSKSRAEATDARRPRLRSAASREPRSASRPKAPRVTTAPEHPQLAAASESRTESPTPLSASNEPRAEDKPAAAPLAAADDRHASGESPQQPTQGPSPTRVPEAQPTPKHALAAEIALMRTASDALQRKDPQAALAQLQRYGTEFPAGALQVEAAALRAIALCTAHSDQAAAVSGKFLQTHASSPLAARVRRACPKP